MNRELKKRKKRFWTFCLAAALLVQCILPLTALAATYSDSNMPGEGYPSGTVLKPGDEILVRKGHYEEGDEATVIYQDEDGTTLKEYVDANISDDGMIREGEGTDVYFLHTVKSYAEVGGTEKTGRTFRHWVATDIYRSSGYSTRVVLQAVFGVGTYDITYHLNGGTNASENPASYTYGVGVASFGDASKENHTFGGWYSDAEFNTKVTSISTEQSGAVDLYAKFTVIEGQGSGETTPSGETQTPEKKSEIPATGDGMTEFVLPVLVMMSGAGIVLMTKKRKNFFKDLQDFQGECNTP